MKDKKASPIRKHGNGKKTLMIASVASMVDQFNMPNLRLMQEMGYEVHVACNFKQGNTCSDTRIQELQELFDKMHIIWHQWDCPRSSYAFGNCWRAYWQLRKLTDQYCFAWIHCHSPVGGALARAVAHQRKIPVVYTAHGFHFYKGAPLKNWLLYYPAEKLLAYWTDVLITINKEDYRFAKRNLKAGKIYGIPGVGIDIGKFAPEKRMEDAGSKPMQKSEMARNITFIQGVGLQRKDELFLHQYRIPGDALLLLSVGELNQGKNHRAVISALAGLNRRDVYYLICGQGALQEELQRYADSLGVGRYLRMPGYQENMAWIYQNADIFVFPSMREGMPVALMEAMAAGLPCVVSDIRGNRELIDGTYKKYGKSNRAEALKKAAQLGGLRISLDDAGQLRDALELFLEDTNLRQKSGAYNQEKIKKFDRAVVQKRMRKIYRALENKGRGTNAGTISFNGNLQ